MTLSTEMYYILVMTKTLYRCHNAGVKEGFAGRRQFVREWEPRFVGPTQLPANEELTHESQSSETVIGDVRCECAEDGGRASQGLSHPGKHKDRELDTGAKGNPRDHENTTVR